MLHEDSFNNHIKKFLEVKNVVQDINNIVEENKNKGFKSNGSRKFGRIFNRKKKKSNAVDQFGDNYFADTLDDYTTSLSITLPKSLVSIIDKHRNDVTRSRFIRKVLSYCLTNEDDKDLESKT